MHLPRGDHNVNSRSRKRSVHVRPSFPVHLRLWFDSPLHFELSDGTNDAVSPPSQLPCLSRVHFLPLSLPFSPVDSSTTPILRKILRRKVPLATPVATPFSLQRHATMPSAISRGPGCNWDRNTPLPPPPPSFNQSGIQDGEHVCQCHPRLSHHSVTPARDGAPSREHGSHWRLASSPSTRLCQRRILSD